MDTSRITRRRAFLIHLGISLAIFLAVSGVMVMSWYRWPLFTLDGGWQGLRIIAGVDLVLGPLLTLIVFNPKKTALKLKIDLTIIAIVQLAALSWGTYITYWQRPVLLVFAEDRFYSIAGDILIRSNYRADDLDKLENTPYPLATIALPDDEEERSKIRLQSLAGGGLYLRGDLYVPQNEQYLKDLAKNTMNVAKFTEKHPQNRATWEHFAQTHDTEKFFYAPLHSRYGNVIAVVDKTSGKISDTLAINTRDP